MPDAEVSISASTTEGVAAPTESSTPAASTGNQVEQTTTPSVASPAPGSGVEPGSTAAIAAETSPVEGTQSQAEGLENLPGFKNLRSSYQKRVQELDTLRQDYEALQAKVQSTEGGEATKDSYIQINAPVDEIDVASQLDRMQQEVPPYYNKLAWEVVERHLPDVLPYFLEQQIDPNLKQLVEASAVAIIQSYTGLTPEQVGEALRAYGKGSIATSTPFAPQTTPSLDVTQAATQYGLDPYNEDHLRLLNFAVQQNKELAALKSQVGELRQNDQSRVETTAKQQVDNQVGGFRDNLVAKITTPPGYEYVKTEIADRLKYNFDSDPIVQQARKNLEAYYKQGTPNLQAASAELTKLQNRMNFHFKESSERRLAEVAELEKAKTVASQSQATVKNFAPGAGANAPGTATPTRSGVLITPENAAEIALARLRASRITPPSTVA